MYSKEKIFELVSKGELSVNEAMKYINSIEDKVDENKNIYDLSEAQKALWILYQMDTESYAYNVPCAFKVFGNLDIDKVQKTCDYIIKRHPILKAYVKLENLIPKLCISDNNITDLECINLSHDEVNDVDDIVLDEARKSFDLETGPLFRVKILNLRENEKIILFNFHHIIFDGISLSIFISEFNEIYENVLNNKKNNLSQIEINYSDFVYWQKENLENGEFDKDKMYWHKKLGGELPQLEIIQDSQKSMYSNKGTNVDVVVEGELFTKLFAMMDTYDTTLFNIMMSAYNVVMYYYGNQEDVIIGLPVSGRPNSKFDKIIGYFVNMIAIRTDLSNNPSFEDILKQVKTNLIEGFEHSNYPYFLLNKEICSGKDINQIFQVSFQFQNWIMDMERSQMKCSDFKLEAYNNIQQDGAVDFSIEVHQFSDKLRVYFKYNPDFIEEDVIWSMAKSYLNILEVVANNPKEKLQDIPLLSNEESEKLIEKYTGLSDEREREKLVFELIDEGAKKYPDDIAIIFEGKSITYGELKYKSDMLAKYLINQGVKQREFVAVYMQRSLEVLISFIAVMKTGATYIPLDPIFPSDRIEYILDESKTSFILYNDNLIKNVLNKDIKSLELLETSFETLEDNPNINLNDIKIKGDDVVYSIYTSGSTGNPKGVLVRHDGLTNFVLASRKEPGFTKGDYSLSIASYSFDLSVMEIYCPLVAGGKFEIISSKIAGDGFLLKEKIDECGCNYIMSTPTTFQMLLIAGWENRSITKICFIGETLSEHLVTDLIDNVDEIWNAYGPTETTVLVTAYKVSKGEKITVGYPIDNTSIYILNKSKNLLPIGVIGEIYIGGKNVGLGYLNRPELTNSKYVLDPFSKEEGTLMYASGDLGRFLPDGSIDYCGRIDHQVKLKGFRIELGEIESHLQDIKGVDQAVVVLRKDKKGKEYLQGYLVLENGNEIIEKSKVVEELKKSMPFYMIPSSILILDDLPRTVSYKINKKYLINEAIEKVIEEFGNKIYSDWDNMYKGTSVNKEVHVKEIVEDVVEDTTVIDFKINAIGNVEDFILYSIKEDMKEIISTILEKDKDEIKENDDISSYGFDSILLTSLIVQVRKKFNAKVNISAFLDYPTIESFASYIKTTYYQSVREVYDKAINNYTKKNSKHKKVNHIDEKKETQKFTYSNNDEDIAIIGVSGLFSEAETVEELYENLMKGRKVFGDMPTNRELDKYYEISNKNYTGSYIQDIRKFDNSFFNISDKEATLMDPQQRIFLETSWNAIEDAGYNPKKLKDKNVGVFVGATNSDYKDIIKRSGNKDETNSVLGSQISMIANRVSAALNLERLSKVIDTGDSSSLSALIEGIQALKSGEIDMAIAGGINLVLDLDYYDMLRSRGVLSHNNKCLPFDKDANGYLRGEGCGVVILKSLKKAEEDNDNIYGVIKGYSESNSGNIQSGGFNKEQQINTIVNAYKRSDIDMSTIQYIEATGFATVLGDMTEINSVEEAASILVSDKEFKCKIGCIRGNVGHLEGASGIVSLIKVLLSMKNKMIPETVGIDSVNPYINKELFTVLTTSMSWDSNGKNLPRRAGINCFSSYGNNVHVIVEEYVKSKAKKLINNEQDELIVLSARNINELTEYCKKIYDFIQKSPKANDREFLSRLSYTTQVSRAYESERVAFITQSIDDLQGKLDKYSKGDYTSSNCFSRQVSKNSIDAEKDSIDILGEFNKGKYEKIADLWVSGRNIDYESLYQNKKLEPIHLPAYPFNKKPLWVKNSIYNKVICKGNITVVQAKDYKNNKEFLEYWKNYKETGESSYEKLCDVSREYLKVIDSDSNKMTHLLVTVPSTGKKIEVVTVGSGIPIVMLPGYGITAPQWMEQFEKFKDKYKMICLHMPGVGLSEVTEDSSLEAISNMFIEVLQEIGIKWPMHVVGSSYGGFQAQYLSYLYPDMVQSLTLVGTSCNHIVDTDEKIELKLQEDFALCNALDKIEILSAASCLNMVDSEEEEVSTIEIAEKITVPTLIIYGELDRVISKENVLLMADKIQNSQLYIMKGVGHIPNATHPDKFNEVFSKFIDKNDFRVKKIFGKKIKF